MLNVLTANDSWYTSLHLTGDNRFVKKNYRSICKKNGSLYCYGAVVFIRLLLLFSFKYVSVNNFVHHFELSHRNTQRKIC